ADSSRVIQGYIARTGLAGHTRNSITDPAMLERELALVRARGYARDNEELELGVRCIAAGIRDDTGQLVAGLSISAPADFVQDGWIELLCRTANQISSALAYDPWPEGNWAASGSALQPAAQPLRVAEPRVAAMRIQQHHDELAAVDHPAHHQAVAGFVDV